MIATFEPQVRLFAWRFCSVALANHSGQDLVYNLPQHSLLKSARNYYSISTILFQQGQRRLKHPGLVSVNFPPKVRLDIVPFGAIADWAFPSVSRVLEVHISYLSIPGRAFTARCRSPRSPGPLSPRNHPVFWRLVAARCQVGTISLSPRQIVKHLFSVCLVDQRLFDFFLNGAI